MAHTLADEAPDRPAQRRSGPGDTTISQVSAPAVAHGGGALRTDTDRHAVGEPRRRH
ncbi:hypothetical protein [Actinoplanes sp. NPDC049118]|uniref:hypothetical protein n=1 Tax=Actinoplanes sp. NPDC049118 TaxID=3155769 RepID=UPI0033D43465